MSIEHFNRILVPIDGSIQSHKALEVAIDFQKLFCCELYILSVYSTDESWSASVSYVLTEVTSSTEEAMKEFAQEVAKKSKQVALKAGVESVRSYYQGGKPASTIVKFAQKHEIDLIILGKKGLANTTKDLIGSISHKVLNRSKCPVMVI